MKTIQFKESVVVVNKICTMRKAQEARAKGLFQVETIYKILFFFGNETEAKVEYDDKKKRDRDYERFLDFIQNCKAGE